MKLAEQVIQDKLAAGIKFVDEDVEAAVQLHCDATVYAREYRGNFDYMVEMRSKVQNGRLSIGQARGVLNCMLAEARRNTVAAPSELAFDGIAKMLEAARAHLKFPKIRLMTSDEILIHVGLAGDMSKEPGSVTVTGQTDPYTPKKFYGRISKDGTFRGSPPATVMAILKEFAADPEAVATAYGRLTGNCCFCGRKLEDERSTAVGYGPVCAAHFGMAWGRKEVAA